MPPPLNTLGPPSTSITYSAAVISSATWHYTRCHLAVPLFCHADVPWSPTGFGSTTLGRASDGRDFRWICVDDAHQPRRPTVERRVFFGVVRVTIVDACCRGTAFH